ncbi:MAG: hypothetical protein WC735_02015 [Candidatus Paceibacterota bacterium]
MIRMRSSVVVMSGMMVGVSAIVGIPDDADLALILLIVCGTFLPATTFFHLPETRLLSERLSQRWIETKI